MAAQKLIIDTDIGDDADDILAIALALTYPQVEIVGITTVFRNTELRAKLAQHLLALAGDVQIPVFPGAGNSLSTCNNTQDVPCQYTEEMAKYPVSGDAQSFYRKVFSKEKVNFVAIGCLTNLAIFIEENPHLVSNIGDVWIMGGCFRRHANEWNIVCDPEAAHIVFNSGLTIRCIGLEITSQCSLTTSDMDIMRLHANTPLKKLLIESCDHWFNKTGFLPVLHDPLVISALIEQKDMGWEKEKVHVELNGTYTRGMTVCSDDHLWGREPTGANLLVATTVNSREFIEMYINNVFISQVA